MDGFLSVNQLPVLDLASHKYNILLKVRAISRLTRLTIVGVNWPLRQLVQVEGGGKGLVKRLQSTFVPKQPFKD